MTQSVLPIGEGGGGHQPCTGDQQCVGVSPEGMGVVVVGGGGGPAR